MIGQRLWSCVVIMFWFCTFRTLIFCQYYFALGKEKFRCFDFSNNAWITKYVKCEKIYKGYKSEGMHVQPK